MIKKLITFTQRMIEMVEEIRVAKGYVSFSAVVHAAVVEMHTKTFPNYMRPMKEDDPAARVRRKAMEKEAREDMVREEHLEVARQLGATIVTEGGKEFAVYYNYVQSKRYEQKVPIQLLSTDLLKAQYQPSREKVEQLQRDKKVDY